MGGLSWGWLGVAPKKWNKAASRFISGTPEKHKRVSTLAPEQQANYQDLQNAASGAYSDAANYYRGNLSDNPADLEAFTAPEMRRYNEQIIPDLAEQYAGMGAGNLSSSGFRNAAVSAGTDLSERLGALRAQLRSQSAQGLQNIGQQALGNYSQDVVTQQGTPGFLSQAAPIIGSAVGAIAGGPPGAVAGYQAGSLASNSLSGNRNTSPYRSSAL